MDMHVPDAMMRALPEHGTARAGIGQYVPGGPRPGDRGLEADGGKAP